MKILKYLFINIVLIIVILGMFEFVLVRDYISKHPEDTYHIGKVPYTHLITSDRFRHPEGLNYKKRPIILFGCSYAYGQGLEDKESFTFKLSEYSKRPVFNYSMFGKGFQHTLFILRHNIIDKEIKNPEYAIYVMMDDHIRRMYSNVCMGDFVGQPMYSLDSQNHFFEKKPYYPVYRQFYTFYYFNNLIYEKFIKNDLRRNSLYVSSYLNDIYLMLKTKYPDIKFIVLMYDTDNSYGLVLSSLNENIKVINTYTITDEQLSQLKYTISSTDFHPNALAWDLVSKALVKELKL